MKDKDRLLDKGLEWDEFKERMDGIFDSVQKLIKDTNGNKVD